MKKKSALLVALLAALPATVFTAAAGTTIPATTVPSPSSTSLQPVAPPHITRTLIATSQDHSLVDADDCEHFHTRTSSSFPSSARGEEQRDVPLSGIDLVKVRTSEEGGISVRGWDRPTAHLTVCKYAMAFDAPTARKALGSVAVSIRNGEIAATGPENSEAQVWWVHMILRVPRNANVDVASANGGIAIRNISGKVYAKATNGGISVAQCTGQARIETENGGISLEKMTGPTDASTQNGPIALKLRQTNVPSIDARTDDDGEILCNLKGCEDGLGNWADNRKHLRIGSAPSIRLSTSRAPIMIEQVR